MNSLSILIYLADILPNLSVLSVILGVVLFFIGLVCCLAFADTEPGSEKDNYSKWLKTSLLSWLTCLLIFVFTPEEKTIYLIAASEIAEEVVISPQGQSVLNKLDTIMKGSLNDSN